MTLDFIAFINQNVSLSTAQKQAMLDDFCEQYGYQEEIEDFEGNLIPNPVSKVKFADERIYDFIRETVHATRIRRAKEATTFEELILT